MAEDPYGEVAYPTFPRRATHPDRLAAAGRLFGMQPAPVGGCRVLEIGCGNGNNLIAMAYALPQSRFVGVDTAEGAIAIGRETIAELELTNITLEAADFQARGVVSGTFDYIVTHGVYSWIAASARERLLALCAELLAEQGIAFISYNAYPGRHVRQMLREMMLYHTRHSGPARERMEGARQFLDWFREWRMLSEPWQALLDAELPKLERAEILVHDDLAPVSQPFYFSEFVEQAAVHGLAYLGEADLHEMFDHRGALAGMSDDLVEREQYLDFLKLRRFRQTLLCRAEVPLDRKVEAERMQDFLFSSPARAVDGELEGAHDVRIKGSEAAESVARALGEMFPLPLPFDDLEPYAGSRENLQEILLAMVTGGFADLHVHDFPCEEIVTERPVASALARREARDSRYVTSLAHTTVELDDRQRELLPLLDGTRRREELDGDLEWFARMALLQGFSGV